MAIPILDDILKAGEEATQDVIDTGREAVSDRGAQLVEDMIRSTAFNRVLVKVEDSARKAVVEETQKNALALLGLAIAGGTIGGVVGSSTAGKIISGGLLIWSLAKITGVGQPKPTAPAAPKRGK